MFVTVFVCLFLSSFAFADRKILHLSPGCPSTHTGKPHPLVRADVPAEVTAKCRNGNKLFTTNNDVKYYLSATLNQQYVGGDCQYYKKNDVNTYHIDVAIAWSEKGNEVYTKKEIHTITCSYDKHGNSTSSKEKMVYPYIAPEEKQHLKGERHQKGNFSLKVVDVLNRELPDDHLHIGRLVRLKAVETSGAVVAFRALSCMVFNDLTSYAILRAGCGDGIVFGKKEGFYTVGSVVYSPYFDAFKLNGSSKVQFECKFTVCQSACDGDSCKTVPKKTKRSSSAGESNDAALISQGLSVEFLTEEIEAPQDIREDPYTSPSSLPSSDVHQQKTSTESSPPKSESKTVLLEPYANYSTDMEMVTIAFIVFGILLMFSFTISLYLCCKYEVALFKTSLNR